MKFPNHRNIKVYHTKNEGYDFGAYSYSIQMINKNTFDYYIFLNDTVIGPFVPRYNSKYIWYENFISLISDKVKLVGPIINGTPINNIPKHVQSMAFGTDNTGLQLLIEKKIFNLERNIEVYNSKGKQGIIHDFEVRMSGVIMENGYEISSFMQSDNYYKNLKHGLVFHPGKYFGITLNPVEIMFIKSRPLCDDSVCKRYIYWNT